MSQPKPNPSALILYQTEDGRTHLQVRSENETVWLTQAQMAELFQTTKQNISLHILNIFEERELPEDSVVKEYLTTAADGNISAEEAKLKVEREFDKFDSTRRALEDAKANAEFAKQVDELAKQTKHLVPLKRKPKKSET